MNAQVWRRDEFWSGPFASLLGEVGLDVTIDFSIGGQYCRLLYWNWGTSYLILKPMLSQSAGDLVRPVRALAEDATTYQWCLQVVVERTLLGLILIGHCLAEGWLVTGVQRESQ